MNANERIAPGELTMRHRKTKTALGSELLEDLHQRSHTGTIYDTSFQLLTRPGHGFLQMRQRPTEQLRMHQPSPTNTGPTNQHTSHLAALNATQHTRSYMMAHGLSFPFAYPCPRLL